MIILLVDLPPVPDDVIILDVCNYAVWDTVATLFCLLRLLYHNGGWHLRAGEVRKDSAFHLTYFQLRDTQDPYWHCCPVGMG